MTRFIKQTSFGKVLRAAKLGFYWSIVNQAWIRICLSGPDHIVIDIVPHGHSISSADKVEDVVEWWSFPDPGEILHGCPNLSGMRHPTKRMQLLLDNNGINIGTPKITGDDA